MSGEASWPPRQIHDPVYALQSPRVQSPGPPQRSASARSFKPGWVSRNCVGAMEHEAIGPSDGPTLRDNRENHKARLSKLQTGGPRIRIESAGPVPVPSHIVSPRTPRPSHRSPRRPRPPMATLYPTRPSHSRGANPARSARQGNRSAELCLRLLKKYPADFCVVIQSNSDDCSRVSEIRKALQAAYPSAPFAQMRGALRPCAVELLFFAACDLSLTVLFSSPPRSLRNVKDGWPTPEEVVRLVGEQCQRLVEKLRDAQERLSASC